MWSRPRLASAALATAAIIAAGAARLGAQGMLLYTWNGAVDRDVRVTMHRDETTIDNQGLNAEASSRIHVQNALPREDGRVRAVLDFGRGTVEVTQQPSAANDYTTVVAIHDKSSGADSYRISVFWEGSSGGEVVEHRNDVSEELGTDLGMLHWTGRVDDQLQLIVRGGGVSYHQVVGKSAENATVAFKGDPVPKAPSRMRIEVAEGRGNVVVTQQPGPDNGYTGTILISDPPPGYGFYDFNIRWR